MNADSRLHTVLLVLAWALAPQLATAQTPFKLYISADMEGVAGVVSDQQILPSGFEYSRFREIMTAEVNTVIETAFAGGVTEIVVSDSHGNGQNLLIEKFPKNVSVVRSWPRPLMMMEGIDETFAGVVLLGYHTSTHNEGGVRAHTLSSARLTDVRINDKQVDEGEISAAIAGHFGVPVIMVTGDDQLVKELQGSLGNVEGAVVKWAHGFHSARTLTPAEANEVIRAATQRALGRIKSFKPYKVATPVRFVLRFKSYRQADMLSYLPILERIDSHTIRYVAKDMPAASRFVQFAMTYEADMDP